MDTLVVSHIELRLYENILINTGKGVVTRIVPDHLMPRDENGVLVDVIIDSYTMGNRKNPGQNLEQSCTFTSKLLLEQIRKSEYTPDDAIKMIIDYCNIICPELASDLKETTDKMSLDELQFFVNSIVEDIYIYMSLSPIEDSITIDTIRNIYRAFPWMDQVPMKVPIKGSDGKIRYVDSRRKVVFSSKYMYRLKQYALEKFSVTSLSATNLKNENTKSKASKNHTALYNNTPVRFGETKQLIAA